jgi:hypothetical protein
MTVPSDAYGDRGARPGPAVDAGRLWAGGVAAGLVAALVAVVGVLVARGLFDVAVLAPAREGALGDATTLRLAALAFVAALLATGLLHLLLVAVVQPFRFFGWIMTLLTMVAVLVPFLTTAEPAEKIATAAIYLAVGVTIGSLVSGVARRAIRRPGRRGPARFA